MAQIKIPKEKVAIVLIEPQNDFLSEGGTMYAHIKEQLAERHVIANLQDLLEKARGQVAKIFYCPFHPFDPGFPELKKGGPACEASYSSVLPVIFLHNCWSTSQSTI